MELLLLRATILRNQIRREEFQGREVLVAPVVGVIEKVLNGEFLPGEEIEASVPFWEGVPIMLDHPRIEGLPVSANLRPVLEQTQLGRLFNVRFTEEPTPRLLADIVLELERIEVVDRADEVLERLENADDGGEPIEVSTAYFRVAEFDPGRFMGEEFDIIQRELRPDHLAILLDVEGACSVDDGCGTPRANATTPWIQLETKDTPLANQVRGRARRPSFDGTETTAWRSPSLGGMVDGWIRATGASRPDSTAVTALPASARRWIASKSLLGNPNADNARELLFFPVVNPSTGRLNRNALRAVLGGRGAQARIPEGAKRSAQNMARRLLESQFEQNADQSALEKAWAAIKAIASGLDHNPEEGEMKKRKEAITALAACEKCPFDKQDLESMEDAQIEALNVAFIEAKKDPPKDAGGTEAEKQAAENKAAEEKKAAEKKAADAKAAEGQDSKSTFTAGDIAGLKAMAKFVGEGGLDALKAIADDQKADRDELIKELDENESCTIGKATLEKLSTNELEELAQQFTPTSFVGLTRHSFGGSDEDSTPKAPPVVLAKVETEDQKKKAS